MIGNFNKLPKWAQQMFQVMERKIHDLEKERDRILSKTPTRVKAEWGSAPVFTYMPEFAHVVFELNHGRIEVGFSEEYGETFVTVMALGHQGELAIRPGGGTNTVKIVMTKREL
jgi:hypothetical protein